MEPWSKPDKILWGFMRGMARLSVKLFIVLKISPNQITVASFLILAPLAAFCFSRGVYAWNLLGLLFCLLFSYFDFTDGLLARTTNQVSKLGKWLDPNLGVLSTNILLIGISYGVYQNHPTNFWLGIILCALFGQFAILAMSHSYLEPVYNSPVFTDRFRVLQKVTLLDRVIKDFLMLESFLFIFFGTLRYLLFFMVFFNRLDVFLLVIAVFYNIRWVIMLWAYAVCISGKETKFAVIQLLREFVK